MFLKIATALPRIVSVFNALDLVTWVAAACKKPSQLRMVIVILILIVVQIS